MSKLWRDLSDEQQASILDNDMAEPEYDAEHEQSGLWTRTDAEDTVIKALFYNDFQAMQEIQNPKYSDTIYRVLWKVVRENESKADEIKAEIERLRQMKDACINRVETAKEFLKTRLIEDGKRKHDTALFSISLRIKPASVGTIDMSKLDERFIRTKQEPDRVSILNHFKETGEVVAGVVINIDQQSVVIK